MKRTVEDQKGPDKQVEIQYVCAIAWLEVRSGWNSPVWTSDVHGKKGNGKIMTGCNLPYLVYCYHHDSVPFVEGIVIKALLARGKLLLRN